MEPVEPVARVRRLSRRGRVRLGRAVVAGCAVCVLAGTTGAAFPSGEHRRPPAVVREGPAPHDPAGGTHKLIRDQIDLDLDDEARRRIEER